MVPPQPDPFGKRNSGEVEADGEGGLGGQGKHEDEVIAEELITPSRCLAVIGSEEQLVPVEDQEADTEDEDTESTTLER